MDSFSKKYYWIIGMLLWLLVVDCRKTNDEPEAMPEPSMTGSNMLACRINGKVFISEGRVRQLANGKFEGIYFSCYPQNSNCLVTAFEEPTYKQVINFVFDIERIGEQQHFDEGGGRYWQYYESGHSTYYYTSGQYSGWVQIDIIDDAIIVGKFEYIAVRDSDEFYPVAITEGWFDIAL